MARMILPKLAGGAPAAAKPAVLPKGASKDLTPEEMEALLAGEDSEEPGEVAEEDETAADEAAETPEEQADEATTGTELHDPNTFATQAAADASEARGYEAQLQTYCEENPDDDAAAQALKDCSACCDQADAASEEARAAADDDDISKAAAAAAEAHTATEEASKCLGGILGAAAGGEEDPELDAVPEQDAADSPPTSGAPVSPMSAWLSRYAR